tara:strand:- start:18761 stop:19747 length:987 start_codon:yes stop_codon:yes gene_type:complete
MLKSIFIIIRYLPFYLKLYKDFKRVKMYTDELLVDIKSRFLNWNDLVDSANEKRMMDYIIVQTMWTSAFCLLRGGRMEENELKAIVNMSALAPLYDDFFDKKDMPGQKIQKLVNTPFDYEAKSDLELLFLEFSKNVHRNVKNISFCLENALRVFNVQNESKRLATDPSLTRKEVKEIAFEKGASTLVFMGNMLNEPLTISEEIMMNESGGVAQFLDDIFDLWEDSFANRKTLSHPISDIAILEKEFLEKVSLFKKSLNDSGFKKGNIKAFYFPLAFIIGATRVCLEGYKKLQAKSNNIFNVKEYSRKEVVCDMEDNSVRWRAFRLSEF